MYIHIHMYMSPIQFNLYGILYIYIFHVCERERECVCVCLSESNASMRLKAHPENSELATDMGIGVTPGNSPK